MYTSAIGYYPDSLKDIINAMKINLELEKKEMIKTFSYSINEEYEGNIIGKNKRSGSTLELVPDFTGKSLSTATSWASRNGIKINSVTVNAGEQYFNSNFATGLITNQNVHVGVLAKEVSSITVYVNGTNNKNANNNKVEETDDNKETDKTESSEDNETKKPGNIDPDNPDLDDLLNIN